jgi:hypothetical protein
MFFLLIDTGQYGVKNLIFDDFRSEEILRKSAREKSQTLKKSFSGDLGFFGEAVFQDYFFRCSGI